MKTDILQYKETWVEHYQEKVLIEIINWGKANMNHGEGVWNYYIAIYEHKWPNIFESLWLEDKQVKFTESSPVRITHDYEQHPISDLDWHGGTTYYEKCGQLAGHRYVKFGCDFNHLHDDERGYGYTIEDVSEEARHTAQQIVDYLNKLQYEHEQSSKSQNPSPSSPNIGTENA